MRSSQSKGTQEPQIDDLIRQYLEQDRSKEQDRRVREQASEEMVKKYLTGQQAVRVGFKVMIYKESNCDIKGWIRNKGKWNKTYAVNVQVIDHGCDWHWNYAIVHIMKLSLPKGSRCLQITLVWIMFK